MPIRYVWGLVGIAIGIGVIVAVENPQFSDWIDDKMNSIQVAKPPIGDITPARDLRGDWTSSLPGRGFQLYGEFFVAGTTSKVYEDGDIDLHIDRVEGNTAYGTIRSYNITGYGQATGPAGTVVLPKTTFPESGTQPIEIHVTGSRLDFGSFNIAGAKGAMQGNYTTDLISGGITTTVAPYARSRASSTSCGRSRHAWLRGRAKRALRAIGLDLVPGEAGLQQHLLRVLAELGRLLRDLGGRLGQVDR